MLSLSSKHLKLSRPVDIFWLPIILQFNNNIDFPSDAQKIEKVKLLIENGYMNKIFLSQDIHTKHRLVRNF